MGIEAKFRALAYLVAWGAMGIATQAFSTTATAPLVVQFNHNDRVRYTEPYRNLTREGDDLEATLIEHVESAQHQLAIAVQEIRLPRLAKAIAAKQRAGVSVRLLLENSYNYDLAQLQELAKKQGYHGERNQEYFRFADTNGDGKVSTAEAAERDAVYILRQAGVKIQDDTADASAGSGLMHHKFMIIDNHRVLVTSANFTMSDVHGDYSRSQTRGNANSLLAFESPKLAALFAEEFSIMWGSAGRSPKFGVQKPFRPATTVKLDSGEEVTVQFAGTSRKMSDEESTIGLILRTLKSARRSVSMALFVFSESEFSESLRQVREDRDLEVKALIEPTFAYRYYSKALDMWGLQLLPQNCRPAPGSNPWAEPVRTVGVPRVADGDFLHHKFAVIDDETTIVGSHNWSRAASEHNDETLLVVKSARVAAAYGAEFGRWYQNASLGAPNWLVKAVDESQRRCN